MIFNVTGHKQLAHFFAKGTAIVVLNFQKTNKNAGNIKHVCRTRYRKSSSACNYVNHSKPVSIVEKRLSYYLK